MSDRRGRCFSPAIETMRWDAMRESWNRKLPAFLERIHGRSPYYREVFERARLAPKDVRTVEDLALLPLMDKDRERLLQEAAPPLGGHACVPMEDVVLVCSSSGTTGRPTFFPLTDHDVDHWAELVARVFWCAGIRSTDVVAHIPKLGMVVAGIPPVFAHRLIGSTLVPIGGQEGTKRTLELAKLVGATVMSATPSFALYLGENFHELMGTDARDFGVRLLTLGAEPGAGIPQVRKKIQDLWGARIREVMGIGEIAPALWAECDEEAGMHFLAQDSVIVELIDSKTGEVVPWEHGRVGEVVYTTLDREAAPFLRYRSNDHVTVDLRECSCGRTPLRVRCQGRSDDMLVYRGTKIFPSAAREVVAAFAPDVSGEIRLVVRGAGPILLEAPVVRVERGAAPIADEGRLVKRIEAKLKETLGAKLPVELVPAASLPRSAYKTAYVERV